MVASSTSLTPSAPTRRHATPSKQLSVACSVCAVVLGVSREGVMGCGHTVAACLKELRGEALGFMSNILKLITAIAVVQQCSECV